jgi:hypothetical protein
MSNGYNFPCKPYGFRDNNELKLLKWLRHAHIAGKTLNIILLLSLEHALIFYFILHLVTWKFRELKATVAGISNPKCSFFQMDINYSYRQF